MGDEFKEKYTDIKPELTFQPFGEDVSDVTIKEKVEESILSDEAKELSIEPEKTKTETKTEVKEEVKEQVVDSMPEQPTVTETKETPVEQSKPISNADKIAAIKAKLEALKNANK